MAEEFRIEVKFANSKIESAQNKDSSLRVRYKEDNSYRLNDIFGNIDNPIIVNFYQSGLESDLFVGSVEPTYTVKNESGDEQGNVDKNTPISLSKGSYKIEARAEFQGFSRIITLYFTIFYEVSVNLKANYQYAISENSPLKLGYYDNHQTKNIFEDKYLDVSKSYANLEYTIYKNGQKVNDIDGLGLYEINIDSSNFILSDGSDKIFYGIVEKYNNEVKIQKDLLVLNYSGKAQDITKNIINTNNLEINFSRKNVTEIGNYTIDFFVNETDRYYSSSGSFNVEVVRSPNLIEHNEVINMIKNSLLEIMDNDYYYYKDYNVILAKEQEFIKLKQTKPNTIYIVIKFGSASINFSQTVLPITLTAMSEQNKLDVCQKLLSDFVNKYNLETNEDSTIRQIYELPVVTSNFNKVFEGFRSILFVNGYFVISKNANFYELKSYKVECYSEYDEKHIKQFTINKEMFLQKINNVGGFYNFSYDEFWFLNGSKISGLEEYGITIKPQTVGTSDVCIKVIATEIWEDVPLLSFNFNADFQLDSQPFFNRDNFSHSKAKYGVLSLNINTYMLSDIDIVNKALNIALKQKDAGIDSEFKLKIKLKNGIELIDTFKLLSVNSQQTIAEIPVISLGFTN